jgi:hypothetical protein
MMNVCVPNKILNLGYPKCIMEYKAYCHRDSKNRLDKLIRSLLYRLFDNE